MKNELWDDIEKDLMRYDNVIARIEELVDKHMGCAEKQAESLEK